MRTIWTILSVLAVVNVLAVGGFVAFLKATDRLDGERARRVRELFSTTLAQDRLAAEQAAKAQTAADTQAKTTAKVGTPPMTAAEMLRVRMEQGEVRQQQGSAAERDFEALRRTLANDRKLLDEERAAFKKEREAYEKSRAASLAAAASEQFGRALTTLEGLKADKARLALQEIIGGGGTDQAVEYLNAMQDRTRTKVIEEFVKTDPKVAADLLERVRLRGRVASAAGSSP